MKVFYHADQDGRCAGYWVRKLAKHYDNYDLKFYEINYGMEFPFDEILKDEQIFINIKAENPLLLSGGMNAVL